MEPGQVLNSLRRAIKRRVDAEKAYTSKGKKNLKAEKKRIVREVSSRGAAKRGHGKEIK